MADKPGLHGRDHRPDGADPMKSGNTAAGKPLEADGVGGTRWGTGGSGIQYNVLNDGEWLWVATETAAGSGLSYGMTLRDNSGSGMELYSTSRTHLYSGTTLDIDSGSVDLHAFGNIALDSDADIAITADGEFTFTAAGVGTTTITSEGFLNFGSEGDAVTISAEDNVNLVSNTGYTYVQLVGGSFCVGPDSSTPAVNQFFRVDSDGSVHTIGPIVEDL